MRRTQPTRASSRSGVSSTRGRWRVHGTRVPAGPVELATDGFGARLVVLGVANVGDVGRVEAHRLDHGSQPLGCTTEVGAEPGLLRRPAETCQLFTAGDCVLVRTDRPATELAHHLVGALEGLRRPRGVVQLDVAVDVDPPLGAGLLDRVTEGDLVAGHAEAHEGIDQCVVGVDECSVEVEDERYMTGHRAI